MKRLFAVIVIMLISNGWVFVQEVSNYAIIETPYYKNSHYVDNLRSNEIVYAENYVGFNPIEASSKTSVFYIWIKKNNSRYTTYAKNIAPLESDSLFATDIAINYGQLIIDGIEVNFPNEIWVPSYYCEVLRSIDRETLTRFEPHLIKYNTGDTFEYGIPMQWYLHEYTHIRSGMYMFYNSMIYAGHGNSFLIKI
jgi:hypothetical protein